MKPTPKDTVLRAVVEGLAIDFENMASLAKLARKEFKRGSCKYERVSDSIRILNEAAKRIRKALKPFSK